MATEIRKECGKWYSAPPGKLCDRERGHKGDCGTYDDGTEVVGVGGKSLLDPTSQSQEETEFWRKAEGIDK